jgi:calcineurin-like phosphoesterase family protein
MAFRFKTATKAPKIFFTSDHRFGDERSLCKHNRQWSTAEEMNQDMIRRWNEVIDRDSIVYHLGDMFVCGESLAKEILQQLNGEIYLIYGDLDRLARRPSLRSYFADRRQYLRIQVYDKDFHNNHQSIVLCHYPFRAWQDRENGSWHLHSRCIGYDDDESGDGSMSVSVENFDFYPIEYSKVKESLHEQ